MTLLKGHKARSVGVRKGILDNLPSLSHTRDKNENQIKRTPHSVFITDYGVLFMSFYWSAEVSTSFFLLVLVKMLL